MLSRDNSSVFHKFSQTYNGSKKGPKMLDASFASVSIPQQASSQKDFNKIERGCIGKKMKQERLSWKLRLRS